MTLSSDYNRLPITYSNAMKIIIDANDGAITEGELKFQKEIEDALKKSGLRTPPPEQTSINLADSTISVQA